MRKSKREAEETRKRIVEMAADEFRQHWDRHIRYSRSDGCGRLNACWILPAFRPEGTTRGLRLRPPLLILWRRAQDFESGLLFVPIAVFAVLTVRSGRFESLTESAPAPLPKWHHISAVDEDLISVIHDGEEGAQARMNCRTLGRTGLQVSEIGYGAWGIGKGMWVGASDDESVKALNKAFNLGLDFVDTALVYGDGHSERLVGQVIGERSETIYVASKIPPKNYQWPAQRGVPVQEAFPAQHVIASTEESLKNLGLESIDVQQFHVWSDEWADQGDWLEAIQKLKKPGRAFNFRFGVGRFSAEALVGHGR